jgi:hypothetical protein
MCIRYLSLKHYSLKHLQMCHNVYQISLRLLTKTPSDVSPSWRGGICSGNVLILILRPLHIPDVLVRRGLISSLLHSGSSSEHLFSLQYWSSPWHVFWGVSLFLRKTKLHLYVIWVSQFSKYQGFGLLGCEVVQFAKQILLFRSNLLPSHDYKGHVPEHRKHQSFHDTVFICCLFKDDLSTYEYIASHFRITSE